MSPAVRNWTENFIVFGRESDLRFTAEEIFLFSKLRAQWIRILDRRLKHFKKIAYLFRRFGPDRTALNHKWLLLLRQLAFNEQVRSDGL